ncbi:MAG: hypothetical protein AAF557_18990 [Pseudomonadota bacterium]
MEALKAKGSGIIVVKATQRLGWTASSPINITVQQRNGTATYNIGYMPQHLYSSFKGPRVIEVAAGSYIFASALNFDGNLEFGPSPEDPAADPANAPDAFSVAPGEVVYLGDLSFIIKSKRRIPFLTMQIQRNQAAARQAIARRLPGAASEISYRPFGYWTAYVGTRPQ